MQIASMAPVIPFRAAARAPAGPQSASDRLAACAKVWAEHIADAADADQRAIALVGVKHNGPADFEELVPRALLEALNNHKPAVYRLTLVLRSRGRDIGIVRLATLRPSGFRPEEIRRARAAAGRAAQGLAAILDAETPLTVLRQAPESENVAARAQYPLAASA